MSRHSQSRWHHGGRVAQRWIIWKKSMVFQAWGWYLAASRSIPVHNQNIVKNLSTRICAALPEPAIVRIDLWSSLLPHKTYLWCHYIPENSFFELGI